MKQQTTSNKKNHSNERTVLPRIWALLTNVSQNVTINPIRLKKAAATTVKVLFFYDLRYLISYNLEKKNLEVKVSSYMD